MVRTRFQAGFLMAQSELSPNLRVPILVLSTGENDPRDQVKLERWIKQYKPQAILTDIAALREMLNTAGLRVPENIGLAALSVLDGNADAGIYQNSEEIGEVAVELLISLIHHNHTRVPRIFRKVLIEGKWVDGASLPAR